MFHGQLLGALGGDSQRLLSSSVSGLDADICVLSANPTPNVSGSGGSGGGLSSFHLPVC